MQYYAPVAPIKLLQAMDKAGVLGREHLLLAHDILAHGDEYKKLFSNRGYFIIMDNSMVELGEALCASHVLAAAQIVWPTAICLPDVHKDRHGTLAAIEGFTKSVTFAQWRRFSWMAIPQGSNFDELVLCCQDITKMLGSPPHYWGAPRWITNDFGSRQGIVQHLYSDAVQGSVRNARKALGLGNNIHLLGMSKDLNDDIICCKMPGVMGIDSANPVVLGQKKRGLYPHEHMPRVQGEWDYWAETELTAESINNMITIRSLIQR